MSNRSSKAIDKPPIKNRIGIYFKVSIVALKKEGVSTFF
jgi:hypothetical protein